MPIQIQRDILVIGQVEEGGEEGAGGGVVVVGGVLVCARCRREIKVLVELDGAPFKAWEAMRDRLAVETGYIYPGPIQYWGPAAVCDQTTRTLALEQAK